MDAQFRANVSKVPRLHIECSLPDPAEVASGPQLATPLPRAGGQDDVSLKETPSNNRQYNGRYNSRGSLLLWLGFQWFVN